ncbi:MAG: hypothetical protein WBC69_10285, partial [Geitlerinemataceae cyanobacterium]
MTSTRETPPRSKWNKVVDRAIEVLSGDTFAYILKRLLQAIPTLFLASILCFTIVQLAPGDYLSQAELRPEISQETLDQMRQQFALDRPI